MTELRIPGPTYVTGQCLERAAIDVLRLEALELKKRLGITGTDYHVVLVVRPGTAP